MVEFPPHMSVLQKIWKLKNEDSSASLLQKLFLNRGLTDEIKIERFLHPNSDRDFHDPFLMKDMARAVERIGKAIEKSERIMIFGDYDVDGITASAIMMRALTKLGAKVSYRLPHRIEDGYGLREKFIKEFAKLEVKIVITVDNGISCRREVESAQALGIDVIITDHHTIPAEIPKAFAILHPKLSDSAYPFADLTGAGVALKLAQALYIKRLNNPDEEIRKLFDLACMGTVSDLGPLYGENRYIVKQGLTVLENTRWPGLSRLKQSARVKGRIDTQTIGFLLGPRINAAGRISHPSHALQLLLHDEKHSEALAQNLERLNSKRQKMMTEMMEVAEKLAAEQCNNSIIIISDPIFHGGIIGLIAGRIAEKYSRPAIAMEERKDCFVGSCRSIPQINIFEVLRDAAGDLFTHFGGHSAAAGFDLPRACLAEFTEKVAAKTASLLSAKDCRPILPIECEITHAEISEKTVKILREFEPFGMGNEVPRFLCKNIPIMDFGLVGADKKHLKIKAQLNGINVSGIGFNLGKYSSQLNDNKVIDAVCEVEEDSWNGGIQIKLVDFRQTPQRLPL